MCAYPKHLATFDYVGPHRYFLTFCTHNRKPFFTRGLIVACVIDEFLRVAVEERLEILAYCFMPDHVHLLVEGVQDDSDLRRFIFRLKQATGFTFQQRFKERLWQRYGYERVLRGDEATRDIVRYTLNNPIRAKLVEDLSLYPFIGSSRYTRAELLELCIK
jgi:REP-associated tyrosine transposase